MNIIDKIRDKVVGERTDALIEANPVSKYEHIMRYQYAAKEAGYKVLDIGCGFGYGSKMLFDSKKDVTSMDVSDKAIEYAKSKYPGPKYICADASVLPFPDGSFDSVTTFDVIEHLKVPEDLVPEIYRVLKPGGTMFISTPNPRHLISILKHYLLGRPWPMKLSMRNFYHIKEFYYDEFIELLKKNKFTIEYQFGQTLIGNYCLILISRYFFPKIFGKLMVLSGYRFPRLAVTVVIKARKA